MHREIECKRCGHVGQGPHPWMICPNCGDTADPRIIESEPNHDAAGARSQLADDEIDTFAQFYMGDLDVDNPQAG